MKRKQFIGLLGNTSLALLASKLPSIGQGYSKSSAQEFVFVEAEQFTNHGGWELDQQSMEQMGSPYLLAHGLGIPVQDATTEIEFPAAGSYRLWVRTKDWVAPWNAPGAPGKFQLLLNGKPSPKYLGQKVLFGIGTMGVL